MDDYSHLRKEEGEEESRGLLSKGETRPEEARELLDRMKYISSLIKEVSLTTLNLNKNYRELSLS